MKNKQQRRLCSETSQCVCVCLSHTPLSSCPTSSCPQSASDGSFLGPYRVSFTHMQTYMCMYTHTHLSFLFFSCEGWHTLRSALHLAFSQNLVSWIFRPERREHPYFFLVVAQCSVVWILSYWLKKTKQNNHLLLKPCHLDLNIMLAQGTV